MMKKKVKIWSDDDKETVIDRIAFVLLELGIIMKQIQYHDDFMMYEFTRCEELDGKNDKNK